MVPPPSRRCKQKALRRYDDELVTRAVARRMLGGIGRDQIAKLEAEGKLHPVKLTNSDKGHVFYRKSEVLALMRPTTPPRSSARRCGGEPNRMRRRRPSRQSRRLSA